MDKFIRSLLVFFVLTPVYAHIGKVITIYGAKNGSHLQDRRDGNAKFELQIGAFKSKMAAANYKNELAPKIKMVIRIIPPRTPTGLYNVVVGPIQSSRMVRTLSNQLLGKKIPPHVRVRPKKSLAATSPKPKKHGTHLKNINHAQKVATLALNNTSVSVAQVPVQSHPVNIDKERQAIEILTEESLTNEIKLKRATNPIEITALQKRQIAIAKELEVKVTKVIAALQKTTA